MSSSDIAVSIRGLGKKYIIHHQEERHATFAEELLARAKRGFRTISNESFWALRDVSFDVKKGDVVGIIGRNGAGKSTLLKILSRITEPTQGEVHLHGRVGSLLEVGTGFHPELTGRENIFLNGSILGMKKAEIQKQFDAIVDFAEVEKFLDTPVKRYSSGMYMRLAFAVAAHLQPEILIIDEVLAVGDAQFQKKCMGKMKDVAVEGRTVLFVSHNMGAVSDLTNRCAQLQAGRLVCYAETSTAIQNHLNESSVRIPEFRANIADYRRDSRTESAIRFIGAWVESNGERVTNVRVGSDFTIALMLEAERSVSGACLGVALKDARGQVITQLFSWDQDFRLTVAKGKHRVNIRLRGVTPSPGNCYVDLGVNQSVSTNAFDVILDFPLAVFSVSENCLHWSERKWGAMHVSSGEWCCSPASSQQAVLVYD